MNHIINNSEFLTECATFLKPPCYVNLWQIFVFCCSFNDFEWFLNFFNKIPFLTAFFLVFIALHLWWSFKVNRSTVYIAKHTYQFRYKSFWHMQKLLNVLLYSLREKYPKTEFFLIRVFSYSDWIRRLTVNLRILSEYRKCVCCPD